MTTRPKSKKNSAATTTTAAMIIASVSLAAGAPNNPVPLNGHELHNAAKVTEFLDSLGPAYALPKKKTSSLLALSSLTDWLNEKKPVYICVQDEDTIHCCTLALKGRKINCLAMKPDDVLPKGAIWLMPFLN